MIIHLVRHSEADYTSEKKPGEFPGVPLTQKGREQAQELTKILCKQEYDYIFCSDMRRTKQTIAPSLGCFNKKLFYDSRIREISDAVTTLHDDNWFEEAAEDQITRLKSFFADVKKLEGMILIVAHYGVIKMLTRWIGREIDSPECGKRYVIEQSS